MSSSDVGVSKARLEAFSDGVIAIVITILVFDIKIDPMLLQNPEGYAIEFQKLVPKLASYALSFATIIVWWISHHFLINKLKHVDSGILFVNSAFLMFVCLIPFPTALLGNDPLGTWPLSAYGVLGIMCSLSFLLLRELVCHSNSSKSMDNFLGLCLYSLGFIFTFSSPVVAIILFLLVPVIYTLKLLKPF
jgi:uncharacterized membrane protein